MSVTKLMVVEDDVDLLEALSETLQSSGYSVVQAGDGYDALRHMENNKFDLIITDIQMPNMDGHVLLKKIKEKNPEIPVMLMTAYGSIQQAVDAMRDGAVDYMVKPFEAEVLVNMVSRYVGQADTFSTEMIAVDYKSIEMVEVANRVAQSNATVMITGESGVGKEVLAQYIHSHSNRCEQPFVAINCAAIPENMLEATLFGYEKGAYTGAYKACPGKFEQAQNGTILLDEITEMDQALQAKLLRVLQEREVERLGGTKVITLNVRIVATSNRNVRKFVNEGKFREDLYYRLNVFPINISSLSERQGDIIPLTKRIIEKACKQLNIIIPVLSVAAEKKLLSHGWPGNVRELDNVVQRALVLLDGEKIDENDIHFEVEPSVRIQGGVDCLESCVERADTLNDEIKQKEWKVILSTITSVKGSRKQAAEKLGISQRTLRYKLAKMREAGVTVPGRSAEML